LLTGRLLAFTEQKGDFIHVPFLIVNIHIILSHYRVSVVVVHIIAPAKPVAAPSVSVAATAVSVISITRSVPRLDHDRNRDEWPAGKTSRKASEIIRAAPAIAHAITHSATAAHAPLHSGALNRYIKIIKKHIFASFPD
jgi:hypothetical protein